MGISEKLKQLKIKSNTSRNDGNGLFVPKEIFRKIIDRERDRANRTEEIFSLVAFLLPDSSDRQKVIELLTNYLLSHHLRSIDVVGWLDSHHVGILLPETDVTGAQMCVNKVFQDVPSVQHLLDFEIFTYPSDKFTHPDNAESDEQNEMHVRAPFTELFHPVTATNDVDYIFHLTKRILKRGFDICGAVICLLVFSPIFIGTAVLIKIVSPGPVFFKQKRIGYGGQPFTFLKFRTMTPGADSREHQEYLASLIRGGVDKDKTDSPMTKLDHNPQIIPFGNFIRKSCIDELPQLINVLRGEMSLVGPRPPIPYEVKEYHSWHRGRFDAIPGMTGLWQVSGKNKLSFREMVRLDIKYAKERSLWLDLKILFRTPIAIFSQLIDSLRSDKSTIGEGV